MVLLREFSNPDPIFRILVPVFLVYLILVLLYNYWYLKTIQKYNFWMLIKLLMLLISGFGIFLVMPTVGLRSLFLVASVFVVALFEYAIGNYSENVQINETILTAFGMFVAILGAALYIPPFFKPYVNLLYLSGIFLSSTIISRTFFEFIPQPGKIKTAASVTMGLYTTEVFWALSFLPFHYSALALLLFVVFYLCLMLNYYYFFQTLSFKKFQFHLILALVCVSLVMVSTPWKIAA